MDAPLILTAGTNRCWPQSGGSWPLIWGFLAFEEQLCEAWAVQPVGKGLHFPARLHPHSSARAGSCPQQAEMCLKMHKQRAFHRAQALQQQAHHEPWVNSPLTQLATVTAAWLMLRASNLALTAQKLTML